MSDENTCRERERERDRGGARGRERRREKEGVCTTASLIPHVKSDAVTPVWIWNLENVEPGSCFPQSQTSRIRSTIPQFKLHIFVVITFDSTGRLLSSVDPK